MEPAGVYGGTVPVPRIAVAVMALAVGCGSPSAPEPVPGSPGWREAAVVFRLAPPAWESDTEVVVDGGHHVNGLNGSGKTYRVRFQGGAWVVVEARWRWIS
jgi:hypothetical protein